MEHASGHSQRQLNCAAKLGIRDAEDMTGLQLNHAIAESPATPEQFQYIQAIFTYLGEEVPNNLTYGQAKDILKYHIPELNKRVLLDKDWNKGDILHWNDGFYRIVAIHRQKYTFTIKQICLTRASGEAHAQIHETNAKKEGRNPFTLLDAGAIKVDLLTVDVS